VRVVGRGQHQSPEGPGAPASSRSSGAGAARVSTPFSQVFCPGSSKFLHVPQLLVTLKRRGWPGARWFLPSVAASSRGRAVKPSAHVVVGAALAEKPFVFSRSWQNATPRAAGCARSVTREAESGTGSCRGPEPSCLRLKQTPLLCTRRWVNEQSEHAGLWRTVPCSVGRRHSSCLGKAWPAASPYGASTRLQTPMSCCPRAALEEQRLVRVCPRNRWDTGCTGGPNPVGPLPGALSPRF